MNFPQVTAEQWRAQVDRELAGAPFDKALVTRTPEGLSIQPLYVEGPKAGPLSVAMPAGAFGICVRLGSDATREIVASEVEGGAEALWLPGDALKGALAALDPETTRLVVDPGKDSAVAALEALAARSPGAAPVLGVDPLGELAAGLLPPEGLGDALARLVAAVRFAADRMPRATPVTVSTLPYHDAGADAADEIAFALSSGVHYLETLLQAGLPPDAAARAIGLRIACGQGTFGELAKLRALRVAWRKALWASGASEAPGPLVHAVCSSRTLAQRDPWVNMLRVTTQVFAAVLGGADLVTPTAFDAALGAPSVLGRRVARNTGLVLREESSLGRVHDPAGGSYYFDTLTDALAREAWRRFQALEGEGGMEAGLVSGRIRARLDASWRERLDQLAKRKVPVLGVSEFANLDEKLPAPARPAASAAAGAAALPVHRDAEAFEALRLRADALAVRPEAVLVTLGSIAESRPRVGFASNFFGAGGVRVRETGAAGEKAACVCLCGTDERYASEAAARARTLKAAGCGRVLVAGRPGPLEAALREAGVDGFLHVGCDAVALLSDILDALR